MIAAPKSRTQPVGQPEARRQCWIDDYRTPAPEGALIGIGMPDQGAESRTQIFANEDLLTRVLLATDPMLFGSAVEVTPAPRALSVIVFGVSGWDAASSLGIVNSNAADTILYGVVATPFAIGQHEKYRHVLTGQNVVVGGFFEVPFESHRLAEPGISFDSHHKDVQGGFFEMSFKSPKLAAAATSQIGPPIVESPREALRTGDDLTSPYRAVEVVRDLQRWLGISLEAIAQMAGTSKSSILYWKREDAEPRPSIYHRLMRLHSLVNALRRERSQHEFQALIHEPLSSGSRLFDLLMAGDYKRAEDAARTVLFAGSKPTAGWNARSIDLPEPDMFVPVGRSTGRTPAKRTRKITPRRRD